VSWAGGAAGWRPAACPASFNFETALMFLDMSWLQTDAMEQKVAFITQAQKVPRGGFAALCRQFGIARKTGYKWRRRFAQDNRLRALEDRSRRPHRSPRRIAGSLVERILELRRPDGWGARKIAYLLWAQGVRVSVATVHRTLLRQGRVHHLDRHSPALRRFERPAPNDLFQADFKGPMGRAGVQDEPLSVLDDHSRYGVGLFAMRDHTWERTQACFIAVFERHGKPRQILLDHGTPWWNTRNGWGLSRLSVFLMEQDIDLVFGRVAHPQTQGKVERFHRTLSRSMVRQGLPEKWEQWQGRYDGFLERYNQVRPHEALGMKRPAERYRKSARVYQSKIAPWKYPEGVELVRVDANGMIRLEGRRYFVCEALVHHQVAAEKIGQQVLVRFRNMYIRELQLGSSSTLPFIHSVTDLTEKVLPMS
jgi:transposase InsO family protein